MAFDPARLRSRLPSAHRYLVALSGGLDSLSLLYALAELRPLPGDAVLAAVHVDHGLHPRSEAWSRRCEAFCDALDIPCSTLKVDAAPVPGESPEAAAREARYRALREVVGEGDCLLAAHHRDDQAETFLIQLLRGGGPRGLAAMPRVAPFGRGLLARPLLDVSRAELRAWAEARGLEWIDDPSNFDTAYDRNHLRHKVVPALTERWPAAAATIARAAGHCAETTELIEALAEIDLARVVRPSPATLSVGGLLALTPARRRNLLLFWFRRRGLVSPAARHLEALEREVLAAADDATPLLRWPGVEVRRYRDALYVTPPLPETPPAGLSLPWPDLFRSLVLPDGMRLEARPVERGGLSAALVSGGGVSVRFRRGGERCRPVGRAHGQTLKRLLQEAGVAPWERERQPLVYVGERLAAVPGLWVCEPFAAAAGEAALEISLARPE